MAGYERSISASRERALRGSRARPPSWSNGDHIPASAVVTVTELLEQGFRKAKISRMSGLPLQMVRVIVDGPGIARYESTQQRREAVQAMVNDGARLKEIVSGLELPENIVRSDLKSLGISITQVSSSTR